MKPVLTDEEIKGTLGPILRACYDPTFLPSEEGMVNAGRDIERLTCERMMELVCSVCGEPWDGKEGFEPESHHFDRQVDHSGWELVTLAEYLRGEEER